ncbi:hypothetical protein [Streptomyces sp. TRM68367]|uniref:hypothetical protein n=1 Tax=Streptomyces sp. TRM68367 TaxID=2758415 RepID=UPI00165C05D1|nr:hypothetical protein [Streptomyces sp. TRM68367]MBC9731456.1 hypothetical protein [Streptomyces sp. TRM68367]
MKNKLLNAQVTAAVQAAALRKRLNGVHEEIRTRGDRGDGPIPFVIIVVASIVGALLVAGGLAALYAKANGKLGDIDLGG